MGLMDSVSCANRSTDYFCHLNGRLSVDRHARSAFWSERSFVNMPPTITLSSGLPGLCERYIFPVDRSPATRASSGTASLSRSVRPETQKRGAGEEDSPFFLWFRQLGGKIPFERP
jgi:hypothetical protein